MWSVSYRLTRHILMLIDIPATVTQPYPHLSKIFHHTLNDKALKIYNTLASQHYTYSNILFLTSQSAVFISKSNINLMEKEMLNRSLMLTLLLLQESMEKILKLKMLMINQLNFKKNLISTNKLEKKLNHTEFITLHYLTFKFWRKFFTHIMLYISHVQICNWVSKPCNTLLVICFLLFLYWNKLSRLTFSQKYDTDNFLRNSENFSFR